MDGTDDAQLMVGIVDRNGVALSNCAPVTLAVESGPGEFPTGPSITFAPDSDIAIRDGLAAIEFRSYYAGKTVIRATSPGLQDATIKITSLGHPKFIPGKTAAVKPRSYMPFNGITTGVAASFGLENPTRASSEAPGHSGRFANDGNAATCWQAASDDTNAWWRVDLERLVTVSQTRLTFPTAGNWRYKIEISDDGNSLWKPVVDQTADVNADRLRVDNVATGVVGRFLRVTFTARPAGQRAALSEVEVLGQLASQ